MPFEPLIFFSEAGNGDLFAISMRGDHEVYVWNHETTAALGSRRRSCGS